MPTNEDFEDAERRMRAIVGSAGLRQPDRVERDEASLTFLWDEEKLAVVVDEVGAASGGSRSGACSRAGGRTAIEGVSRSNIQHAGP
jgi:hypothetical protein